jgi:hypothetical protein
MQISRLILLACTLFWGESAASIMSNAARQSIEQKKVVKIKDLTDIGLMAVRP